MQNGMKLEDLLTEVIRQKESKRDFVASTKESLRMVESKNDLFIVMLREGSSELERFEITKNAHQQIASRLQIPWKYYTRLLNDHRDLVVDQVNALFEREPETRLVRTLDGKARAFLSNRYRRLDNDTVLENVLPSIVKGEVDTALLSSHVNENNMYLKVLFTDDSLAIDMGEAPGSRPVVAEASNITPIISPTGSNRNRRIVRPGIIISNSETGNGSLSAKGFLFDSYCTNGCVWGVENAWSFQRTHIGGKLIEGTGLEVFSDDTQRKEDDLIVAQVTDALTAMSSVEHVKALATRLQELRSSEKVINPIAGVDQLMKELPQIQEGDRDAILTTFIRDGDYSQWGMLSAVTERANNSELEYERATEFEELGGKIAAFNNTQWMRIATAEKVAVA